MPQPVGEAVRPTPPCGSALLEPMLSDQSFQCIELCVEWCCIAVRFISFVCSLVGWGWLLLCCSSVLLLLVDFAGVQLLVVAGC